MSENLDSLKNEEVLAMLNKYFSATPFEKYPRVMIQVLIERATDKVLGKNFAKQRISKKKQRKIQEVIKQMMQGKYGPYINFFMRKMKTDGTIHFSTNFNQVFRVEFLNDQGFPKRGLLYGSPDNGVGKDIFYTTHCFEQFKARCAPEVYARLSHKLKSIYHSEPTPADVLSLLISYPKPEIGHHGRYYYLGLAACFVVLEDYNDFFVAKTCLKPVRFDPEYDGENNMANPAIVWTKPRVSDKTSYDYFRTMRELIKHPCDPIEGPSFLDDWMREMEDLLDELEKDTEEDTETEEDE